jgi:putative membrane protein
MAEDDKEQLAQARTDLSEDRTMLANERTFAGWLRTGFASVGIALAFNALFVQLEPPWVPKAIATSFLGIAIIIFVAAERRACAVLSRMHAHRVQTLKISTIRLTTILTVTATLALVAAIWLLKIDAPAG